MKAPKNPFEIRRMTEEEGGGYLVTFKDLPGCVSDGDTIEEAVQNAADAEEEWLSAAKLWGKPQPAKLVARLPRSLHEALAGLAKRDGVSINTMMVSLISRGVGEAAAAKDETACK